MLSVDVKNNISWLAFKNVIYTFKQASGIVQAPAADASAPTAIYSITGQRLAKPTKGIVIINGKKEIVK